MEISKNGHKNEETALWSGSFMQRENLEGMKGLSINETLTQRFSNNSYQACVQEPGVDSLVSLVKAVMNRPDPLSRTSLGKHHNCQTKRSEAFLR